ncbi:hypothetical protein [Treponema sp.]|nr:hypothetical protein [Treponema sp.]MBR4322952.1 hypothetical protein [Treponema sp.]
MDFLFAREFFFQKFSLCFSPASMQGMLEYILADYVVRYAIRGYAN